MRVHQLFVVFKKKQDWSIINLEYSGVYICYLVNIHTSMRPNMSLQMRALEVILYAAVIGAHEDSFTVVNLLLMLKGHLLAAV